VRVDPAMGDNSPGDPGGLNEGSLSAPPSPAAYMTVKDDLNDSAMFETQYEQRKEGRRSRKKKKVNSGQHSRSRSRSNSVVSNEDINVQIPVNNSFTGLPMSQESVLLPLGQNSALLSGSKSQLSRVITPPTPLQASPPISQADSLPATPSLAVSDRKQYKLNDPGPYTLHVQYDSDSPGATLHPVTFGQFIHGHHREFPNVVDGSLKSIGRNRISISFHSAQDANNFLLSNTITNKRYKAFIPSFNVTRVGIVKGIPTEWTPDDIQNFVKVPTGCGPIIKSRRLNFKKNNYQDGTYTWVPSETVILTFDGQVLPSRIFACYNSFQVDLYTYPTTQCYQCCRFGHTKNTCRSVPRCFRCGGNHSGDKCEDDSDIAKCVNCKGETGHFATSKSCPEYTRQCKIKKTMA
jgi:hypothetical protein